MSRRSVDVVEQALIATTTHIPGKLHSSMTQARKLGFTGYQDSELALLEIFERMQKDGVIPAGMVTGKGLGVVPDSKFA